MILSEEQDINEKIPRIEEVQEKLSKMSSLVRKLESSLSESEKNDKELVFALHVDNIKKEKLESQLQDTKHENRQILDVLQQQFGDNDVSRSSSRSQLDTGSTSCCTVSMVHLQYKYEELMSSHDCLLKLLETKVKEIQNASNENHTLREEIEKLKMQLEESDTKLNCFIEQFKMYKAKKKSKIRKLKNERNTLRLVHNQLVDILTEQCVNQEQFLSSELYKSSEPMKSLLLNEVRKNNKLQYENSWLKQEILYYVNVTGDKNKN